MDIQIRMYLKKMIDDASDAHLIVSVLQRFQSGMSEQEVYALRKAIALLSADTREYLGIGNDGQLIEDMMPQEIYPTETEGGVEAEQPPEEPIEEAPIKQKKKPGYT